MCFPLTSSNSVWCLGYLYTYLSSLLQSGFLWSRSSILLILGFWTPSTQEESINVSCTDLNCTDTLKGSVDFRRHRNGYFCRKHPSLAGGKKNTNICSMMMKKKQKYNNTTKRQQQKIFQIFYPKTKTGLFQVPLTRAPRAEKVLMRGPTAFVQHSKVSSETHLKYG